MRTVCIAAALTAALVGQAEAAQLPQPGAATPQTLKTPSGPGSVRGLAEDPTVSTFTGQMSYVVPIDLPAAPGDFKPELNLQYHGGLGNGSLGVGWQLGFPSLVRSTRLGVPRFDADDELELGGVARGGRLVRLTDGSYRVMGEGQFTKVVAKNGGFEATDGNGRVYALGTTAASRLASGGKIAAWLPDSITDLAGQKILFSYKRVDNEVYLTALTWGPGQAFRAELTYAVRPDPVISYRSGFRIRTGERLSEIRVLTKPTGQNQWLLRSKYALAYDDLLPLSRLAQVTHLGRDGVTAWPATVFSYAKPESPKAFELTGAGGWVLGQAGVSLLDVDGDGVSDLLKMAGGTHAWRRNRGGTFASSRSLTNGQAADLDSGRIMDLDGDAKPELVRTVGGAWSAQRLLGETWGAAFNWAGTANLPLQDASGTTNWIDIDGDSRTDVVKPSGAGLAFYKNGTAGYAFLQTGPISSSNPGLAPGQAGVRFFDANGDGLEDVLWLAPGGLQMFLGRGDATFEQMPLVSYPWNGAIDLANLHLADMNRDGIGDLVRVTGSDVELYYGRGVGFDAVPRHLTQPLTNVLTVTVADANGNGSQDLVWCSSSKMFALDLAGTSEAGMLTAIDNGLGKRIDVAYEASGVLAMNAEIAGSPWIQKLPTSIPVVTSTAMSPGADEPERRTDYMVRDAFWDPTERRFGGYLEGKTIIDPGGPHQRIETVKYHAGLGSLRALRGKILTSRVEVAGNIIQTTDNEWKAGVVAGLTAAVPAQEPLLRFAMHSKETVKRHEGVLTPVQTVIERKYDDQGRVIEERNLGRADLVGDEIISRKTYASDDLTWVRDRVTSESIHAGDDTMVSEKRFFFGDHLTILPLGQIGRGWLRAERKHLVYPGTDRWVPSSTMTYDALGNLTGGLKNGVLHKVEYDARGLYPVRETSSPAPGKLLEWKQTWDELLGQVATISDPSGTLLAIGYDTLGRPLSMARNGRLPHVYYDYDWRGPRPETTTWEFLGAADSIPPRPVAWTVDGKWRRRVARTNGAGDEVMSATQVDTSRWIVERFRERNGRGLTVGRVLPFYFDGAEPPTTVLPSWPRETVSYDALDRSVQQTLPDGTALRYSYSATSRTTQADGLAAVRSTYDGQGRIVRTERSLETTVESVDATYDAAGRVLAMSLQDGQVTHHFTYDTLGRLKEAQDPDIGLRRFDFDDADRMVRAENATGQSLQITWDGVGRPLHSVTDEGAKYVYHHDEARSGVDAGPVAGRLGWVEEPSGEVAFGYSEGGEVTLQRRTVLGQTFEERTQRSATGVVLGQSWDDGLQVTMGYDPAGRLIAVGDLWTATSLDAAGRVLGERSGNGAVETYTRDLLGRPVSLQLTSGGQVRLALDFERAPFGALTRVVDHDGVGLAHDAQLTYDSAGRLTSASLGIGPASYSFTYAYDALENMVQRTATGPTALGILTGSYRHGENGAGPRQLTSIDPGAGGAVTELVYDAAGRQVAQGEITLGFDVLDQLVRVDGASAGDATYGYGYEGHRTYAKSASGTEIWFSPSVVQHEGARDHYITVGERQIARVRIPLPGAATAAVGPSARSTAATVALLGVLSALALLVAGRRRRTHHPRPVRAAAAWATGALLAAQLGSCAAPTEGTGLRSASASASTVVYFHEGATSGPAVITRADGSLEEERQFEPFGQPIAADLSAEPHNSLNRPTDPTTGWSYHGARWMAPETGRWISPDPVVKAPDAKFLASPWALNPYPYAAQNPVQFWDPDGHEPVAKGASEGVSAWLEKDHGWSKQQDGGHMYWKGRLSDGELALESSFAVHAFQGEVSGALISGNLIAGKFQGAGGDMQYGLHVDIGGLTLNVAAGFIHDWIGYEGALGTLSVDMIGGSHSWNLGFSSTGIGAGLTLGRMSSESNDTTFRCQLFTGPAANGRWSGGTDTDRDGRGERAIGFDYGIASCDFRTELRPAQVVRALSWTYEQVKQSVTSALSPSK